MHPPSPRGRQLVIASVAALLLGSCSAGSGASSSASSSPPRTVASPTATSSPTAPSGPTGPPSPTPSPVIPRFRGRITVVGLGDSVTAASHCHCTDFITQLARTLPGRLGAPGTPVNLGRGGLTTEGLQTQVGSDAATRTALSHAGVVVVTIGANDLGSLVQSWLGGGCPTSCVRPPVTAMGRRLATVLATVRRLTPAGARILVTDYWAVFQDGDVARALRGEAFVPWADALTRRANRAICTAADSADATCVDLYVPFKGSGGDVDDTHLLASDGDHPNAAGEAVITRVLRAALS